MDEKNNDEDKNVLSFKIKVAELKFLFEGEEISWAKGNLWDLHELYPADDKIEVIIVVKTKNQ